MIFHFLFVVQTIFGSELSRNGFLEITDRRLSVHFMPRLTLQIKKYPYKRQSKDLSDRIDENAADIQYILQAFTELQDRFTKLEHSSADQGKGISLKISAVHVI